MRPAAHIPLLYLCNSASNLIPEKKKRTQFDKYLLYPYSYKNIIQNKLCYGSRVQLKCDGTRWRREGKWRGNWRMAWVASTLHTTSEHGVSSITTADVHTSAASSRLNGSPRRFKWIHPFRRKKKSGFCACAITFQTQSTTQLLFISK